MDTEPETVPADEIDRSRRRRSRRLRALLAAGGLALGLHAFVQLDRSLVERLGPTAAGFHDLFHQEPGAPPRLTAESNRLIEDVRALGGEPSVTVTEPGYLGTLGQTEWANVSFRGPALDDAALARLAERHGGRIGGLELVDTSVTDAGLRCLGRFAMLRHLRIRQTPPSPGMPAGPARITDSGLVHLSGLRGLWTLDLGGLPVTDAGLESIRGLPGLIGVYLSDTEVRGAGLAGGASLPRISILYLDGTELGDDGLKALAGATALRYLCLDRVPLSESSLPLLRAIPALERLELTGCGLLDEEVADLVKSEPGLKVTRR